jgi:hypothetical protein
VADYATTADLTALGVSTDVLSDVEDAQKEAVITARSRFADGYLAVRYTIPDGGLTEDTFIGFDLDQHLISNVDPHRVRRDRGDLHGGVT